MSERVSTGIKKLDEILKGGFIKGRTYLISGEAGTGKTTFCLQFLREGALKGEPGLYVGIDERIPMVLEDARSLGWELTNLPSKIEFSDISPYFLELKAKKRPADMDFAHSIVDKLKSIIDEMGARRLAIDTIVPLVPPGDLSTIRDFIRELIFTIEETLRCTTIITSEIPAGTNKLSRYGAEELFASGVIVLGFHRKGNKLLRTLLVRKMRATPVDLTYYTFEIREKEGIVITGTLG